MQLELLPTTQMSPQAARVRQGLSPERQAAIIAALARLMEKAIAAEPGRNPDDR